MVGQGDALDASQHSTVVILGQSRMTVQEFSPCVSQRGGTAFLVSRHLAATFP